MPSRHLCMVPTHDSAEPPTSGQSGDLVGRAALARPASASPIAAMPALRTGQRARSALPSRIPGTVYTERDDRHGTVRHRPANLVVQRLPRIESRLRQNPHGLEPRDRTVAEPLNSQDADDLPGPQTRRRPSTRGSSTRCCPSSPIASATRRAGITPWAADAATAVETAREEVAAVIGADPREIVWTSGATESDNLALQGVAHAPAYAKKRHVVTVTTEHRAVLDACEHLEGEGIHVTYLRVDGDGRLDLDRLAEAITDRTLLVSIMHANNETGVLHPIARIGALCRERGVLFHTDATQSWGKEPLDVNAMHVDLLSASAHKIHGPKGVGMLFVRRRGPRVRCKPMVHGGGHERGLRSGTLNVPRHRGHGGRRHPGC